MPRPSRAHPPREPLFPVDADLLRREARDRGWSVEKLRAHIEREMLLDLLRKPISGGFYVGRGSVFYLEASSIRDRVLRAPNAREIVDAIRSAIDAGCDRDAIRILIESALPPEPYPPPAGAPPKSPP